MNEELMLEITRRHQCELRQLAQALRATSDRTAVLDCRPEEVTIGSRIRGAWEATLRPLRSQA